ncbi:MAG: hypothetical protein WC749_08725 [Dehalococcoidia bacterium]
MTGLDDTKWIDDLVGTFTDPIIVYPSGWEDTIPQKLREAVTIERLIENIKISKGETPTATDAECCIYLYTICMAQPLSHEWAQIYLYLGTKEVERDGASTMPADIRVTSLSPDEERYLADLRHWIYDRRMKARGERRKREKADQKMEQESERTELVGAIPSPQMQLF